MLLPWEELRLTQAAPCPDAVPESAAQGSAPPAHATPCSAPSLREQLERCECDILKQALANANHNRALAARALGISPHTPWRKLKTCKA